MIPIKKLPLCEAVPYLHCQDPSASHNGKHAAGNGGSDNGRSGIANINSVNHIRNFTRECGIVK